MLLNKDIGIHFKLEEELDLLRDPLMTNEAKRMLSKIAGGRRNQRHITTASYSNKLLVLKYKYGYRAKEKRSYGNKRKRAPNFVIVEDEIKIKIVDCNSCEVVDASQNSILKLGSYNRRGEVRYRTKRYGSHMEKNRCLIRNIK